MNAEILAVGSELLTPQRVDTNSLWLTGRLNELGVEVVTKTIVGDDRARLASLFGAALERSEIVILTGGLGPTEDDVTRDAVAQALGRGLVYRDDLCEAIADRFRRMNRTMAEINKRQAYLVEGAEALPNPRGTAAGQWLVLGSGRVVMLLPGPPRELEPMFAEQCEPRLRAILPALSIATLQFRIAGMPESDVDALVAPVYTQYTNPVTTILAAPGDIQLHLRARCSTQAEAEALVAEVGAKFDELLGDRIYSRNGNTLESTVGELLRQRKETLAVAESCTGGMLAQRITSVPGSSDYFRGGFLVYSDEMKARLLGIDRRVIEEHTAVSEPVAVAMARAARERTGSSCAVSVTGYAGPDGGTEEHPAGTVYLGFADAHTAQARKFRFVGERQRVRQMAVTTALDMLRRRFL